MRCRSPSCALTLLAVALPLLLATSPATAQPKALPEFWASYLDPLLTRNIMSFDAQPTNILPVIGFKVPATEVRRIADRFGDELPAFRPNPNGSVTFLLPDNSRNRYRLTSDHETDVAVKKTLSGLTAWLSKEYGPPRRLNGFGAQMLPSHGTFFIWNEKKPKEAFELKLPRQEKFSAHVPTSVWLSDYVRLSAKHQSGREWLPEQGLELRRGQGRRGDGEPGVAVILRTLQPIRQAIEKGHQVLPISGLFGLDTSTARQRYRQIEGLDAKTVTMEQVEPLSYPDLVIEQARKRGLSPRAWLLEEYTPKLARHLARQHSADGVHGGFHSANLSVELDGRGRILGFIGQDAHDVTIDPLTRTLCGESCPSLPATALDPLKIVNTQDTEGLEYPRLKLPTPGGKFRGYAMQSLLPDPTTMDTMAIAERFLAEYKQELVRIVGVRLRDPLGPRLLSPLHPARNPRTLLRWLANNLFYQGKIDCSTVDNNWIEHHNAFIKFRRGPGSVGDLLFKTINAYHSQIWEARERVFLAKAKPEPTVTNADYARLFQGQVERGRFQVPAPGAKRTLAGLLASGKAATSKVRYVHLRDGAPQAGDAVLMLKGRRVVGYTQFDPQLWTGGKAATRR